MVSVLEIFSLSPPEMQTWSRGIYSNGRRLQDSVLNLAYRKTKITMELNMKKICITLGDPNGLGPELCNRIFSKRKAERPYILIGPEKSLEYHLDKFADGKKYWTKIDSLADFKNAGAGYYLYCPPAIEDAVLSVGSAEIEGGRCAGTALETAVDILKSGLADALVTCPLNKAMLQLAGFDFPGHTEFLAQKLGVGRENVCMHLGGPKLKVSLVTTHPSIRELPDMITEERILRCLNLTDKLVKSLGLNKPIAVCGLNPHAGESGRIGKEEIEIIEPALEKARSQGLTVEGPFPADTLFYFAAQGKYSAVLAMYHDQGLGPLKLFHFNEAINITLGLPYPRTSPDHGTGYDITGKGTASLDSMVNAIESAILMAENI